MLMGLLKKIYLFKKFFFFSIRSVAQFLIYVIIYQVDSYNRGLEFHFIKLFIMTVDMG